MRLFRGLGFVPTTISCRWLFFCVVGQCLEHQFIERFRVKESERVLEEPLDVGLNCFERFPIEVYREHIEGERELFCVLLKPSFIGRDGKLTWYSSNIQGKIHILKGQKSGRGEEKKRVTMNWICLLKLKIGKNQSKKKIQTDRLLFKASLKKKGHTPPVKFVLCLRTWPSQQQQKTEE